MIPKMMDALVKPTAAPGLVLTQVPVPEVGIGEVLACGWLGLLLHKALKNMPGLAD